VQDGLRVRWLPQAPLRGGRALLDPHLGSGRAALAAALRAERADLVHVHHFHGLDLCVLSLARAAGSATVVTLHDYFATCARFFRVRDGAQACPADQPRAECARCLERDAPGAYAELLSLLGERERVLREELAGAGARLAVSDAQRRELEAIPQLAGLDFESAALPWAEVGGAEVGDAVGARTPARGGTLSIVTWGGLVRGKGLRVLVDACAALAQPARVELHHHGPLLDAAFAEECRSAARGFKLELHGPFEPAALPGIAARHDLAAFPSLFHETHGYAVDEALRLGLPVLVSDRGAPPERIGTRGLVTRAGDAAALSACLSELLDAPETLARLRGGRHAPVVGLHDHLARLDALYARALSRRPAPA